MCFLSTTFPNAPTHPPPPLMLFDQSLNTDIIFGVQLLNKLRRRIRGAFET